MILFIILVVLVFFAQILELFIPPLEWMYNAHIYLVPIIVFYGAMALPFPLVLALASFVAAATAHAGSGVVRGRLLFYENNNDYCPSTRDCTGANYLEAQYNSYLPVSDAKVYVEKEAPPPAAPPGANRPSSAARGPSAASG